MKKKIHNWLIEQNIIIIFVVIPLIFSNGYFNIVETKSSTFILLQIMLLVLNVLFVSIKENNSITLVNILCTVFICECLFSNFISDYSQYAFWGNKGWGMGTVYWILCMCVIWIGQSYEDEKYRAIYYNMAVSIVICIIAFINIIGIDILDIYAFVGRKDLFSYVSTIGNINAFAEYVIITFPVVLLEYMKNNSKLKNACLTFICIIYDITVVLCNSDLALFGMFLMYLTGMVIIIKEASYKGKIITLYKLLSVVHILLYFLLRQNVLMEVGKTPELFALCTSIFMIGIVLNNELEKMIKVPKKNGVYIYMATVSFIFIIMIKYRNVIGEYFRFNDSWGTNRGRIWRYSFEIFKEQPIIKKLFGNGCDTFGIIVNNTYGDEIHTIWNGALVNAHCSFWQLIISVGVVGAIIYYAIIFVSVRNGLKSIDATKRCIAYILMLDLVQGLFNNFQPSCMPLICVYIGIVNNRKFDVHSNV